MRFLKMHGAGNDFIVLDRRENAAPMTESLARALGDRHRGVGYDQLVEITGESTRPVLTFWNSDGSLSGACGNATRCVAALIMDETNVQELPLRTARGQLLAMKDESGEIRVNMGQPQLDWAEIPLSQAVESLHLPLPGDPAACGMGNPHCVFFVPDAEAVALAEEGARFEHDPLFPEATNVEFAEIRDQHTIRMRVWERGAGITLACGSGACAVAVSAQRRGLTQGPVRILADGGALGVEWRDDGVWLSGPTATVFEGTLSPAFLETHS